jgi:hypothetical protein
MASSRSSIVPAFALSPRDWLGCLIGRLWVALAYGLLGVLRLNFTRT